MRLRRRAHVLTHPAVQLGVAVAVTVGGAWLVALWMVGVVLMAVGALVAADAVLRDTGRAEPPVELTALERFRRAR